VRDYAKLGADIEALLECLPRVTRSFSVTIQHEMRVVPGRWRCRGCNSDVERPGLCDACGAAADARDIAREFDGAVGSIPAAYIDTSREPLLASVCALADGANAWVSASRLAEDIASGEVASVLVWGPESGSGKSSFACAVLRCVVRASREALLYWRPVSASRLDPLPREPRVVALGRGARVLSETSLLANAALGPDAPPGVYALAERVPVLVLDGMGSGYPRAIAATTRLLEERWDRRRPSVISTPLSPGEVGRLYGGAIRRRLCDDRASRVVRVL
jgi:hypothetical protein